MKLKYIEISSPGSIRIDGKLLIFEEVLTKNKKSLPLIDLELISLCSNQISVSTAALRACGEAGVLVSILDQRGNLIGQLVPYGSHRKYRDFTQCQVELSVESKAVLWTHLVRAKINNQIAVLTLFDLDSSVLCKLLTKLQIGDYSNIEAQAAKNYWPILFGADFRRDREKLGINAALNYTYAIVRSALLRAIIASGLNPQFGVFHSDNRNPYPLVDDLIEPLRPFVDYLVKQNINLILDDDLLSSNLRKKLAEILLSKARMPTNKVAVSDLLLDYCRDFRELLKNNILQFSYPK